MPITRREFIAGLGAVTGIRFLSPIVVRAGEGLGEILPDAALSAGNRVIVIFQSGGNDGLNTVIPTGGSRYDVYAKVRPSIAYTPAETLATALSRSGDAEWQLGLNPTMKTLHRLYRDERVAIVQGVDYPQHNYSHFVSTDIWESGQPQLPDTGWLGRHLDRAGVPDGSLRGLGIGRELPLILQGDSRQGAEVESIPATRFADKGFQGTPRHQTFARYADAFDPSIEPLRHFVGQQARHTVALVNTLETVPAPPSTQNQLANALLTARTLLETDLGVECVFVQQGGYDTHTTQVSGQEKLLTDLDRALEALFFGTLAGASLGVGPMSAALAARTLVITTSEFGRRIGENGSGAVAGTDHGAAAPLFLIGPPPPDAAAGARLVPGLHGEHPNLGTVSAPADNLTMTTELRRVYQAVLQSWLVDPDPAYDNPSYSPLPGLFT